MLEALGIGTLPIILIVAILMVVTKAWLTVPQGFEFTLERFGKYKQTLGPGFHLITPFFEKVGRRMNMMEQVLDVPQQDVITKDNVSVRVDGIVFIHLHPLPTRKTQVP